MGTIQKCKQRYMFSNFTSTHQLKWNEFCKLQSKNLLKAYTQHDWVIQDDIDWTVRQGVVDLFVFKYWYSYAEESVVTHIADYANAIKNRCLTI